MANLKFKGKRHLPLPKGPYTVGCTDIMTGNDIKGTFVRLYYPTDENGILEHYERWPLWSPNRNYTIGYAYASAFPLFITASVLDRYCGDVYMPVICDATPITKAKPFPVVVFSHGLCSRRNTSSTIHVELASQGYIVVAIEHRDQSAGYTYYIKSKASPTSGDDVAATDKTEFDLNNTTQRLTSHSIETEKIAVPFYNGSTSRKYATKRNKQVHQRAEECSRALDLLRDVNEGTAPRNMIDTNCGLKDFQGLLDMGKVALAGHSFGGATVLMGLATDPRFRVGLTLDPWTIPLEMEAELPSRLTQPILFINSTNFHDAESLEALKRFEPGEVERKFITISGTTHLSQCDLAFMVPNILNMLTFGRIEGNIFTHSDIQNNLMLTFLSKHLDVPVKSLHESYVNSKSSLIRSGIQVERKSNTFLFIAFLVPSILLGIIASYMYVFKMTRD